MLFGTGSVVFDVVLALTAVWPSTLLKAVTTNVRVTPGAIAPALDIPDGKKGIDWLDVFVLLGNAGFPALGSVEKALHQAA